MSRRHRSKQSIQLDSENHIPLEETIARSKRRKKRSMRRWFFLLIGLLCVIQLALNSKNDLTISKQPKVDLTSHYRGHDIVLGDSAFSFKGLKEVPSKLASLRGLSTGSKVAQKAQYDLVNSKKLPLEVENSVGIKFRLVPAGDFSMGSPQDEKGRKSYVGKGIDIEAKHWENISEPFYVSKFEISQAQWKKVMGDLPGEAFRRVEGDDFPVVELTWPDAVKFCKKLAEMEGIPVSRYRLLFEREWEYVCRAGTETAFYFSDMATADHFVVYDMNSKGFPNEVGTKRPNAWGVYNMHGNVWEWCADYYKDYFTNKPLDVEEYGYKQKNIRGGSWKNKLDDCRSANRLRRPAWTLGNMLGFRILRKVQSEIEETSTEKNTGVENE